jgi:uncharacterized protein (UPF0332 family)
MSFDWKEFFHFAESLVASKEPTPNEAQCRSAVSRAYYSVHHTATEYIKNTGDFIVRQNPDPRKSASSHQDVIRELETRKASNKKIASLYTKMNQLLEYRQQADYAPTMHQDPKGRRPLPVPNVLVYATTAVDSARTALRTLDMLFEDLQKQS